MKINQQRLGLGVRRQRGGQIDGHGRGADAALGTNDDEEVPGSRRRCHPRDALDSRREVAGHHGIGDPLADAGAHGLEHHLRIELAGNDDYAGRRVLVLQQRNRWRQRRALTHIQDNDPRRFGTGLREVEQFSDGDAGRTDAAGATRLLEFAGAASDDSHINRHRGSC